MVKLRWLSGIDRRSGAQRATNTSSQVGTSFLGRVRSKWQIERGPRVVIEFSTSALVYEQPIGFVLAAPLRIYFG
jgi:hypothetical protein